ncbi:MAG: GNAT family N-acetyltransferase [Candidatus Kapaibacterium sp.]
MDCREILYGSREYEETVALRDVVLRRPLGLVFSSETLKAESSDFHLACYGDEGELLACLILTPEDTENIRMRQVAVREDLQGGGIGTTLVQFSEEFAKARRFSCMTMHARESAVPFYERLNYERYGERFEEVTIPHWKMRKKLVAL